jgi:hypothetical protein
VPATKRTDLVAINLRLPKGLHKALKQQAKRNGVPLNTEIVSVLEGYEAATVKRMTEIVQPLLDEAVSAAARVGAQVAVESLRAAGYPEAVIEQLQPGKPQK